jgi:hypothetical protein
MIFSFTIASPPHVYNYRSVFAEEVLKVTKNCLSKERFKGSGARHPGAAEAEVGRRTRRRSVQSRREDAVTRAVVPISRSEVATLPGMSDKTGQSFGKRKIQMIKVTKRQGLTFVQRNPMVPPVADAGALRVASKMPSDVPSIEDQLPPRRSAPPAPFDPA